MSARNEHILSLTGLNKAQAGETQLRELYHQQLQKGMVGLCFSPYEETQKPGDELTKEQVERRLKIIKPTSQWVRSFSCTEGNEHIPIIAKDLGMKTLVGAWLGEDEEKNQREIDALIALAKSGVVDICAVGNEVLYRKELSETQLLAYIEKVKQALPNIPVGYVDAYYEFENRPQLTKACDVVLANCYPYWEGCHIDYSLLYMKDMYQRAKKAANGKRVIITETGWPSHGEKFHGAQPSESNAMKYFIDAQYWSEKDNIEMFYFSSFDESWKVGAEGDVGAYWGIWDKHEQLKYQP
jgi:exo-beta-1,3-glucanase (GH17 family)